MRGFGSLGTCQNLNHRVEHPKINHFANFYQNQGKQTFKNADLFFFFVFSCPQAPRRPLVPENPQKMLTQL